MANRGVNKVILVGHLGQDPEAHTSAKGDTVVRLSLATTQSDNREGQQRESTEWHRLIAFGRIAEIAGKYLRKGAQVYVEGQLRTRSYQQNGHTLRHTQVLVRELQMLGRGGSDSSRSGTRGSGQRPSRPSSQRAATGATATSSWSDPDRDNEIPF